jgi:predicted dehydrogenase
MDKKLGFAVLGCGSIAEIAHFPSIKKTQGVELIACCDINKETAANAAKKWGAKYWFLDYKELLSKCAEKLDVIIISTPNNVHRNQAIAAAKAGLHIVVEKPLAVTNYEAWDIVKACRQNKVKLMVGCDRRFWT